MIDFELNPPTLKQLAKVNIDFSLEDIPVFNQQSEPNVYRELCERFGDDESQLETALEVIIFLSCRYGGDRPPYTKPFKELIKPAVKRALKENKAVPPEYLPGSRRSVRRYKQGSTPVTTP